MAIDTLQLAKDLQKDFTSAQAETLARVLNLRVGEDLATKADIRDVRSEIQEVRFEIKEVRSELRESEQRLRGEIKDLKVEMVKWIVGALLINFFGVAGLMITLIKIVPR